MEFNTQRLIREAEWPLLFRVGSSEVVQGGPRCVTVLHRCAHRVEAPSMLRPGKSGTALFATLALLGAEFVALYGVFMAYSPASVFVSLQTVQMLSC